METFVVQLRYKTNSQLMAGVSLTFLLSDVGSIRISLAACVLNCSSDGRIKLWTSCFTPDWIIHGHMYFSKITSECI